MQPVSRGKKVPAAVCTRCKLPIFWKQRLYWYDGWVWIGGRRCIFVPQRLISRILEFNPPFNAKDRKKDTTYLLFRALFPGKEGVVAPNLHGAEQLCIALSSFGYGGFAPYRETKKDLQIIGSDVYHIDLIHGDITGGAEYFFGKKVYLTPISLDGRTVYHLQPIHFIFGDEAAQKDFTEPKINTYSPQFPTCRCGAPAPLRGVLSFDNKTGTLTHTRTGERMVLLPLRFFAGLLYWLRAVTADQKHPVMGVWWDRWNPSPNEVALLGWGNLAEAWGLPRVGFSLEETKTDRGHDKQKR